MEEVVHQANSITREDEVPAVEAAVDPPTEAGTGAARAAQPKRNDSSDEDDRKPSASSDASGTKKSSSDVYDDDDNNKPLEYHASYINEKLDYINGFDKNIPIKDLQDILEIVDMLDELVVSYNMSKLRSKLRREIAATQGLLRKRITDLRKLDRRSAPTIAEEGTDKTNKAAAAAGRAAGGAAGRHAGKEAGRRAGAEAGKKHGRKALQEYVEANLNPILEELQRRMADFEEGTSPVIERVRRAEQRLEEDQRLFNERYDRRMNAAEQSIAQHGRDIGQLQEGLANVQENVANLQLQEPQQQQQDDLAAAVVSDEDDTEEDGEQDGEE